MRSRSASILLGLIIGLVALYGAGGLILFLKSPYVGIHGEWDTEGIRIEALVSVQSTQVIHLHEQVSAVQGVSVGEWVKALLRFHPNPGPSWSAGRPMEMELKGPEGIRTIQVTPRIPSTGDLWRGPFLLWAVATFILFCSGYLMIRYFHNQPIRILSFLFLALALNTYNNSGYYLTRHVSGLFPLTTAISLGSKCLIFSSWFYLILIFLRDHAQLRIRPWYPWAIYVLLPTTALCVLYSSFQHPLRGLVITHRILDSIGGSIVILVFLILILSYRTTADAVLRAQLKWLLWGYALGIFPYLLLYCLPNALTGRPLIEYRLCLIPLPLMPLSIFLAIHRYRLMDVDRVIHGSLVYGISVGLLSVFYLLAVGILHERFVVASEDPLLFRADLILLLTAALVFNPLKNLVQLGIDRVFFPERRGLLSLLMEESERLARASSLEEIKRILLEGFPRRMSVDRAAVALVDAEGDWELSFEPRQWLKGEQEIVSALIDISKAEGSQDSLPEFWITHPESLKQDRGPLVLLKEKGVSLIIPLVSGDELWGLYLLGGKTNNRLFSSEEASMAHTLCTQAAHLVGNARLVEGLQRTNRALADLSNRLIQAKKMADLGEGAAILAHELKTPLGIVRGSAEVLLKADDPREREEVIRFILEEVDRLSETVDDFLHFARIPPPTKEDTDLNELVESAAFLWESRRRSAVPIRVRLRLDPSIGKVSLDPRQVYQVLLNILTNAEEAMPEEGELLITTGSDSQGKRAWISVKDSGNGIPQEHLRRVFERFYTTKDHGLGLGLAVVKKVMEAHGGAVRLKSFPGGGTEVALHFPVN